MVRYPSCIVDPEVGTAKAEEERRLKLDSKVYKFPTALANNPSTDQHSYSRAKAEDTPDAQRHKYVEMAKRILARFEKLVPVNLRSRSESTRPLSS